MGHRVGVGGAVAGWGTGWVGEARWPGGAQGEGWVGRAQGEGWGPVAGGGTVPFRTMGVAPYQNPCKALHHTSPYEMCPPPPPAPITSRSG